MFIPNAAVGTGAEENYTFRNFIICNLAFYYYSNRIKEVEMGGKCSTQRSTHNVSVRKRNAEGETQKRINRQVVMKFRRTYLSRR
jgi:hypothetical protein